MTLPPPVASGPSVERLDGAALRSGEPFTVLYGPGVSDLFVNSAYLVCTLEHSLWQLLRAEGYERIVFSSLQHPLYFLDTTSRDLSVRGGGGQRTTARPGAMRTPRMRGPLGTMVVPGFRAQGAAPADRDAPSGAASAAASAASAGSRAGSNPGSAAGHGPGGPGGGGAPTAPAPSATDPFGVMTLAWYLQQPEPRTAVVFSFAEELLQHTEAARPLAAVMGQWAQRGDEGNLWVMVFRKPSLEDVAQFVEARRHFPLLETFVRGQAALQGRPGTIRIDHPQAAELERLVHVARLRWGLRIEDWPELDAIVKALATHPRSVRAWRRSLRELARAQRPLSGAVVRDVLGDGAVADHRSPWERLDALQGMDAVRSHFERLRGVVEAMDELGSGGASAVEPPSPHLVFTGSPGTGKTTVARLVGEIYRDLGLLSRGHVEETKLSDLIAGYVGQTAGRTEKAIDRALDGVLFIDEAYGLSDQQDGFGNEALQVLLRRMEDDRARLVVVVAGYEDKIAELLASNPGLAGRFPQENVLRFPDYPPQVLADIALRRLADRGPVAADDTEAQLRQIVHRLHETRDESFANGRDMRTLADAVFNRWAARVRRRVGEPVLPEDIPAYYRDHLDRPAPDPQALLAELDAYVGLGPVREVLTGLTNRLRLRQARGQAGFAAPHLLFTGPPGTGKTTVARMVGKLFRDLGLLRKGHVVESGRATLVGAHLGETARLVQQAVQEALDGVLFIDEAYSLVQDSQYGGYGAEAIDTLTLEMEKWRGRLVVIAAGYPREMDAFLAGNPGLPSRFAERVLFPDYSLADLGEILRRMAAAEGCTLGAGVPERAGAWLMATRRADPASFGNARTVRKLVAVMEGRMADRFVRGGGGGPVPTEFLPEDVPDPPARTGPGAR